MRLKSLQLKGFKSFADETVIHFNEKVIGIVGPNGSGKSNIVDAIRWVLGEQSSRELRLEKMGDVIFNGAKSKKESGVAQVSLTFDNTKNIIPTEFQTVTISRLLYRTGESEYRINNVACRLKDVTSLFLDTGIGSNSYAIIALGMVDDILADKENARRRMFEQAAGISKFKTRKKETLSKLKSTSADLERVEDLLFELEENMNSLEKQARRTQRYFDIKLQYKELSIQLALQSLSKYKDRFEQLQIEIEKDSKQFSLNTAQLTKEEASLQKEKLQVLNKEKKLSEFQKKINEKLNQLRTFENDRNIFKQKKNFAEESISRIEKYLRDVSNQMGNFEKESFQLKKDLNTSEKEEKKLLNKFEKIEKEFILQKQLQHQSQSSLDKQTSKKNLVDQQLFELDKRLAVILSQQSNIENDINRLKADVISRNDVLKHQKGQLNDIEKVLSSKRKELEKLRNKERSRQEQIAKTAEELQLLYKESSHISRKLDATIHEFELLKSLIENMEGFPESIRYLHANWNAKIPVLADIINADDTVQVVIEQYLDAFLNHFVVSNTTEAIEAIGMLSKAQKGKANFFILDRFKGEELETLPIKGLARAIDLVESNQKYTSLLNRMLYNVYVFDGSLEELSSIANFDDLVILSKNGHFVKKRFSLSGGSVGLFEGKKLGRKKNVAKLESKLKKLTKAKQEIEIAVEKHEQSLLFLKSNKLVLDIQKLEEETQNFNMQQVQLKVTVDNLLEQEAFSSDQIRDLEHKFTSLNKSESTLQKQESGLREKLHSILKGKDNQNQLDELSVNLNAVTELYNQGRIDLIKKENERENLEKEIVFNEKRISELNERQLIEQNQLKSEKQNLKNLNKNLDSVENQLEKHYGERETEELKLSEYEREYFEKRTGINAVEEKIRVLNHSISTAQIQINDKKEKLNSLKFKINSVVDRLNIEFKIDREELLKTELNESLDYTELELKVEKLHSRLERYGDINPMAVESFNAVKERFDEISKQRNDILEAKDSLIETIKEIEESATMKFMQSFTAIRENFRLVFRKLFSGGDDCDLILIDPTDPLESEIEVIAKPKGKRPKSLSQLSGGEKTLTATALLFALYLLKPAPFCILDEVDAPLDDSNVQKFNRIIQEFSKDSQFIVVTHNKATMAAVDVLYGVFMPKQGLSRLSAVDFRSYEYRADMQEVA